MEISVFRDKPLAIESRLLPAEQYNLARTLQTRSTHGVAFVPVRSMQVLAILDAEEFIFLESQYRQFALLAWRGFRPQARESLDDPVPFTACFYREDAPELQRRLQPELFKAMQLLAERGRVDGPARLLKFEGRPRPGQG